MSEVVGAEVGRMLWGAGEREDPLQEARLRLDRRFDRIAREYAGQPVLEVLGLLEREVRAAGVTPLRPDLSALARQISADSPEA